MRRTLLVACAVVVAGGLAYGMDRLVIVGHRLYVKDVEHGNGVTQAVPTSAPTTTTSTIPGPPLCTSPQLNAYLDRWLISDATLYEIVVLTNISEVPCSLVGYTGLGASGENGVVLSAPVSDVATLGAVAGSVASASVVLVPGAQAWFEVSYSVACSVVLGPGEVATGAPNECYAGSDLQVIVPQATSALLITEPLRFTFGTAGFQVGPFQGGPPPSSPPLG